MAKTKKRRNADVSNDPWAGMREDSAEAKQERRENSSVGYNRSFAMSAGTLVFRIYPELIKDDSGNKRFRVLRRYHCHNFQVTSKDGKSRWVKAICEGDGCRMCKEANRLEKAGYKFAYKFKSSLEGLVKTFVYEAPEIDEDSYLKEGEQNVLILGYKQVYAIDDLIAETDPEDIKRLFNRKTKALAIKMTTRKVKKKWECSAGFHHKKYELEELDEKMPKNLDNEYITTEDHISDEDFKLMQKAISRILSSRSGLEDAGEDEESSASLLADSGRGKKDDDEDEDEDDDDDADDGDEDEDEDDDEEDEKPKKGKKGKVKDKKKGKKSKKDDDDEDDEDDEEDEEEDDEDEDDEDEDEDEKPKKGKKGKKSKKDDDDEDDDEEDEDEDDEDEDEDDEEEDEDEDEDEDDDEEDEKPKKGKKPAKKKAAKKPARKK